MSKTKFQRTKPHVNYRAGGRPGHSVLAVALSHAILKDVVDYRIAQEDAIKTDIAENRIEVPVAGWEDDGAYPTAELSATIDAGGP
jgi:translation elongation factor EF-Tu-like GTPase